MIDILLVNSNSSLQIYQNLNKISQLEPPIWASLIAKNLSLKGYRVNILDAEADRLTIKEIGIKINEINPKLVCFVVYGQQPSASTQNMTGVSLCLKELNHRSTFGTEKKNTTVGQIGQLGTLLFGLTTTNVSTTLPKIAKTTWIFFMRCKQ